MTKKLAVKYNPYIKVDVAQAMYRRLELESDKSGYSIRDVLNMKLVYLYEQQRKYATIEKSSKEGTD